MGGKRQIGAFHFLMGDTVSFTVVSILQFFFIEEKTGEAVLLQLPDQRSGLSLLDGEGENKLQQSGM
ncbi:hypothetical protein D3C86_2101170 [compost metagenome]